jgi:hypothetical protein
MPVVPRETARDGSGHVIDWAATRDAFVDCNVSTRQFAEQRGIGKEALMKRAAREHWLDERAQRHPEWSTDWKAIEALYVACDLTIPEFARAHHLSAGAVRRQCDRGNWAEKRARDHAPGEGVNWAALRILFVQGHGSVRRFARVLGLPYKTVLRHARTERWEDARTRHNLRIEERHLMKDSKMKAKTEEQLDAWSDDYLSTLLGRLQENAASLTDPRDVKIAQEAWNGCIRGLRLAHGMKAEKAGLPGKTIDVRYIQIIRRGPNNEVVVCNLETGSTDVADTSGTSGWRTEADPDSTGVPEGPDALPAAGGGTREREDAHGSGRESPGRPGEPV